MQPNDYTMNVVSPIQRALQANARAQAQANQDRQFGLEDRRLDMTEANQGQAQLNRDRSFGFEDRRVNLAERAATQREALLAQKVEEANAFKTSLQEFGAKKNKNAGDYTAMMLKHPELAQELKATFEMQDAQTQKQSIVEASQVYAALNAGSPEVAKKILQERLTASENSGDKQAVATTKASLSLIDQSVEGAKSAAGLYLAAIVNDGKQLAVTLNSLDKLQGGNSASDIKRLGTTGRGLGLSQAKINRALATTRGKPYEDRLAALNKAAGKKSTAKAKKPSQTSTSEMAALIEYGQDLDLDRSTINRIASATREKSIEDRFIALENAKNAPEGQEKDKPKANASGGKTYEEGARLQNPTTGEIIVLKNGKWVKG